MFSMRMMPKYICVKRKNLAIRENVLLLAKRIKNKLALGKIYKSSVQNIPFLNKEIFFHNR